MTFDGEGLNKYVDQIQAQNPDIILIAGDFVDEDTEKSDMIAACRALSRFDTPYGTYFVFGNHDKGKYSNGRRGYTGDDLIDELTRNGVTVLQDESVRIDDRFYLIGRQDASEAAAAQVLMILPPPSIRMCIPSCWIISPAIMPPKPLRTSISCFPAIRTADR